MRPTAEGLEEENRDQPKPETRETATPAEAVPPPPIPPAPVAENPLAEEPAATVSQPDWYVEPPSPPSAPIFAESPAAVPPPPDVPLEAPRFEEPEEPYEEDDGSEEELEAAESGREDKEEDKEEDAEKGRTEGRRRRSRGRRGGRRRNGQAAAATAPTDSAEPAEDEEDEPWRDEPAWEEPAPAPRRIAPAPPPAPRSSRGSDSYVIPPSEVEREIVISVPERHRAIDERKIALFCDLENIALGVRDSEVSKFDIGLVLERLLEKGKIIVKKAYADWERYSDYKRPFHEAAIELIDIPQKYYSGKNSADIKMVVDAMDLSYSKEHLDTFVLLSGDSDFSPLVSKLKENNKYVIGIGVKNSSSNLLVDNCDEFIYYEDVWRDAQKGPKLDGLNKKTAEAFSLMIESIQALIRENKDVLWGSMIKQTMQRKKPSFNEGYYGYSTFSELLEDAERKNILKLKKDQRSGTYIVTGFAKTGESVAAAGRR
jgi:uncharacterized protein (TIGR00288 family)